jgi:thioredoxin 1
MSAAYKDPGPSREEVDAWTGPVVLEFGTDWCGYCQGARPAVEQALAGFPAVRHVKVADGKGKPLGRSFTVKLWPTLVFMKDGREMARAVRPDTPDEVREGLKAITPPVAE